MKPIDKWAVCPRPDDVTSPREPKTFQTEKEAKGFLNRRVRFKIPKDIAKEFNLSVEAVRAQHAERERQRKEALRKLKTGELNPLTFPSDLRVTRNRDQGWTDPLPIVEVRR